jgi:hypothetical protein
MPTTVVMFIDPLQKILERELDVKEKAKKMLEKLHEQKRDLVKAKKFTCVHCNKESLFGTLGFVQEHRYEAPWGCTGGDTWHRLQKNLCNLVCPRCATLNYIYNHPQKEKITIYLEGYGLQVNEIFAVVYDNHPTKRNSLDLTQVFPKE